jgi:hypothetical protein
MKNSNSITVFWLENLKVRNNSEDLGLDGRIIYDCILGKYGGRAWIGFIQLRIGTSSGIL